MVKGSAKDPTYLQTSFKVKDNVYGATLNPSQLQKEQPGTSLKKELR